MNWGWVERIGSRCRELLDPFQYMLVSIAGWMNQHQQQVVEYLREENRVLREQIGIGEYVSMMTSAGA